MRGKDPPEPDGQRRLYRWIVNPDLAGVGFVGFNSSFATTLSAELGAAWLVRYVDGMLKHQPTRTEMQADIERMLVWKRKERPVAALYGGLCIAPFHFRHFDQLVTDIGGIPPREAPLGTWLKPLDPVAYGASLRAVPDYVAEPGFTPALTVSAGP